MTRLLTVLGLSFLMYHPSLAQEYSVAYYEVLELHPDSLAKRKHINNMCDSLWNGLIPLSTELNNLCNEVEMGYYSYQSTAPYGCSWYCATGPDTITSSSVLESELGSYSPMNLHDFNLNTAWVEGATDPIGTEIIIRIPHLEKPVYLNKLIIYNGYTKSLALWEANGRVKSFELYANNRYLGKLNLEDRPDGQVFEIENTTGNQDDILELKFVITDFYPGSKYNDICISEINFDGVGDH